SASSVRPRVRGARPPPRLVGGRRQTCFRSFDKGRPALSPGSDPLNGDGGREVNDQRGRGDGPGRTVRRVAAGHSPWRLGVGGRLAPLSLPPAATAPRDSAGEAFSGPPPPARIN